MQPTSSQPLIRFLARAALLGCLGAAPALADQHPNLERGFDPASAYEFSDFDQVNLFNGNLSLRLPIGQPYRGNGNLSYAFGLSYNSKIWDWNTDAFVPMATADARSSAGFGWRFSLGELYAANTAWYNPGGDWLYVSPDGAEHGFYTTLIGGTLTSCLSNSPCYTRDGSYLRLKNGSFGAKIVEGADGSQHTFEAFGSNPVRYRLKEIKDVYGNKLVIDYGTPEQWNLTEYTASGAVVRTHQILFTTYATYDRLANKQMVKEARLAAFGGTQAVYTFTYSEYSIPRPKLHDDLTGLPNPVWLPFLTDITLPDQSHYKMPGAAGYYLTPPEGNMDVPGILTRLNLPTGGRLEWSFKRWSFPSGESYVPGAPPREQPDFITHSSGIAERRLYDTSGLIGTWTYQSYLDDPAGQQQLPIQRRTVVTEPSGARTVNYFSVDQGGSLVPTPDSTYSYYGLPLTPLQNDGSTRKRFLSREVFASATATTPLRRHWVAYDYEPFNDSDGSGIPSRRLASDRVDFVDDSTYRIVDYTDFDGLGHYRRVVTSGNFPNSTSRDEYTNWNPGAGAWPAAFTHPDAGQPWVLGTFTDKSQTENGETARQEYCFEAATGFLQRERIRRLGTNAQDARDLLRIFDRDATLGNPTRIRYFGGDTPGNLTAGSLCGLSLPTLAAEVELVYEHGSLKSRRYKNAPYFDERYLIDAATGLPSKSYDVSGIETVSSFDAMGRIVAITPEAGQDGRTQIVYTPMGAVRATANVYHYDNGGTTLLKEEMYRYDGLGRLWRESFKAGGASAFSHRLSTYSAQDWLLEKTEWATDPAATTTGKTTFSSFDPFGRPGYATQPDGHQIHYFYEGERRVSKQYTVGSSRNAGTGQIVEHLAGTSEVYDLQGRAVVVEEGSINNNSQDLIATYSYGVEGSLKSACLKPRVGGTSQCRTFTWDRRGFLLSDQQPESGTWTYSSYDPLGKFTRKANAAAGRDLRFEYDAFQRSTKTYNHTSSALMVELAYGDANIGSNKQLGKVVTARRFNLVQLPWTPGSTTTVEVKESYSYAGRGGRPSYRKTEALGRSFEQSWTWDPLGNASSVGYPRCIFAGCAGNAAVRTIVQQFSQGALTNVASWAGLSYHPNGMLAQVAHQNGVSDFYDQDPNEMRRPANVRIQLPNGSENQLGEHLWDGMGNLVKRQVQVGSRDLDELGLEAPAAAGPIAILDEYYLYDDFGRLKRYNERGGSYQAYTYDPYSNVTSIEHFDGWQSLTRSYAATVATNRLASGYTYNPAGELEIRPMGNSSETFAYDVLGAVTSHNFPAQTFLYTVEGERLYTLNYASGALNREEWTLRDLSGKVLTLYEKNDLPLGGEAWAWKKDYVYRGGLLLGEATSDNAVNLREQHFTLDHLGNPRLTTDKVASLPAVAVRHFYGYGEEYGPSVGSTEKMRFTGHERTTGAPGAADDLDYMHARYAAPFLARFQSPDPVDSADRGRPHTWNRYLYAAGNPLAYVDPDGREAYLVVVGSSDLFQNPDGKVGHVALWVTSPKAKSQGISYNGTHFGEGGLEELVTAYVEQGRETEVYLLKTTPEQDLKMIEYLAKDPNAGQGKENDSNGVTTNCVEAATNTLTAGGVIDRVTVIGLYIPIQVPYKLGNSRIKFKIDPKKLVEEWNKRQKDEFTASVRGPR